MAGRSAGKRFARRFDSLPGIFDFMEGFFAGVPLDTDVDYAIKLAVEELFTNMVKYGRSASGEILIDLQHLDDRILLSLTDFDAEPFDIRTAGEARIDAPIEQRRPGGLGIHLVKKVMDGIEYEYVGRCSKTTFTKLLRKRHA